MKRQWHHPESPDTASAGRRYWRSAGELDDTPDFREWLEREFPRGAAELKGPEADDVSRRNFLKYMGAATSLAGFGMSGCRRPEAFLVPYTKHVEWIIPGKPLLYSSVRPGVDDSTPLVVTTHEGRPIKLDGNPLHPGGNGGSDAFTQASILDLYDPDRSKQTLHGGEASSAEEFDAFIAERFKLGTIDGGQGVAFLVGDSSSPTRAAVIEKLRNKYPKSNWFRYEPLSPENLRRATRQAFGPGVRQVPRFNRADRVLSLNCDFLGIDQPTAQSIGQFSRRRRLHGDKKSMNRLYTVEPAFTLTGGMADHRLRLPASQINKIALLFAESIAKLTGDAGLSAAIKPLVSKVNKAVFDIEWIHTCAEDLAAAKGKALIVAGPRQSTELHLLVARMNEALGSFQGGESATIELLQTKEKSLPGIRALANAIKEGQVSTLFVTTEGDPVYDAPANLDFAKIYASVETTVHLGLRRNATARASTWHLPAAHFLESWGDALSATGLYSIVQPAILPLYGGISELELCLKILDPPVPAAPAIAGVEPEAEAPAPAPLPGAAEDPGPVYGLVMETLGKRAKKGDLKTVANHTLRDGFLAGSRYAQAASTKADAEKTAEGIAKLKLLDFPWKESMEVVFSADATIHDGRYINNGWLQEVPDPVTKLTWDNAALMSFKTARDLGIEEDGEMIRVEIGGESIEIPALKSPGHADNTLSIAVGYGQQACGRVGEGTGFNVYPLRTAGIGEYVRAGAVVKTTGKHHDLAVTSEHYSMEGRALVREGTLERFVKDPDFAASEGMDAHIPQNISLYKGPDYLDPDSPQNRSWPVDPHHQWAMTIDLNSCIGCNACVIACQAENNIPIVGKDQVIKGREMHWIRMDRYFSSAREETSDTRGRPDLDEDRIEMLTQPVACVHCESAPCETVCPVNATVHSDDGLNVMAYNRCIGTRYCANNCPYKARRFNFFDYNKRPLDELYRGPLAAPEGLGTTSLKLQKNPDVSVRMRGVIEKCTYCVQRIQTAKIKAARKAGATKDVQVETGGVTVACQQACPAEAIVFGNLKDSEDKIHESRDNPRNYDLLKYIGTRPRTSYLARVRNPNAAMPDAAHVGGATVHMH